MSNVSGISKEETIVKGKPTFVRRVSNMLKDGTSSQPPLLFRHASMQKLRHCCQNLNLFPYLLYSYDKSHPLARKINGCISELLRNIAERFFLLYKLLRYTALYGAATSKNFSLTASHSSRRKKFEEDEGAAASSIRVVDEERKPIVAKFERFERQRRKRIPIFLTLAVYLAPLILAFEIIALSALLIFDKYTPGFVFLISALMFLACIAFRVLFHETSDAGTSSNVAANSCANANVLAKCEKKKKVQ